MDGYGVTTMSQPLKLAELSSEELRSAVGERYGEVATSPRGSFNFPVGRAFAEAVGYPPDLLDRLPDTVSASFAGVAGLPVWLSLKPGMTVVDLGCGAGLDTLVAAGQVGRDGRVIGVDVSAEMAALARRNVAAAGFTNVEIVESPVEQLPLAGASVDAVIANGIVNLSPEKERLVAEVARVLRPGGTMTAAEIVLTEDIPRSQRATLDDWFR